MSRTVAKNNIEIESKCCIVCLPILDTVYASLISSSIPHVDIRDFTPVCTMVGLYLLMVGTGNPCVGTRCRAGSLGPSSPLLQAMFALSPCSNSLCLSSRGQPRRRKRTVITWTVTQLVASRCFHCFRCPVCIKLSTQHDDSTWRSLTSESYLSVNSWSCYKTLVAL
jgi:hypothetical protein